MFPRAAITKYRTGDLKEQKFILSLFCRLEILNQGVGRTTPSLKARGEDPSLPPSFWLLMAVLVGLWTHHSNLCLLHADLPVRLSVSKSPFYSHWVRAHPDPTCSHLTWITSSKTQFPNKITFTGGRS